MLKATEKCEVSSVNSLELLLGFPGDHLCRCKK